MSHSVPLMSHFVPHRPTMCIHFCPTFVPLLPHSIPQGVSAFVPQCVTTFVPLRPTYVPLCSTLSHNVYPLLSHFCPTFVPLSPHSVPQGVSNYVPLLCHKLYPLMPHFCPTPSHLCPTFVPLRPTYVPLCPTPSHNVYRGAIVM
jgi:hypothetical protein